MHRGFLDVLQCKKLRPHFRGEDENRRLWYLCGAIGGHARQENFEEISELYLKEDLSPFGRDFCPRSKLSAHFARADVPLSRNSIVTEAPSCI